MNEEELKSLVIKKMRKEIEQQEDIIQALNRQIKQISTDEYKEDVEKTIVDIYCPCDFGLDVCCDDFLIDEDNEEECCEQCWKHAYKLLKKEE